MSTYQGRAIFELGSVYATPGALRAFDQAKEMPLTYLLRHQCGDWGDLCAPDKEENEKAIVRGGRLFSAYHLPTGVKFYVITEAERTMTTVLLPYEY